MRGHGSLIGKGGGPSYPPGLMGVNLGRSELGNLPRSLECGLFDLLRNVQRWAPLTVWIKILYWSTCHGPWRSLGVNRRKIP